MTSLSLALLIVGLMTGFVVGTVALLSLVFSSNKVDLNLFLRDQMAGATFFALEQFRAPEAFRVRKLMVSARWGERVTAAISLAALMMVCLSGTVILLLQSSDKVPGIVLGAGFALGFVLAVILRWMATRGILTVNTHRFYDIYPEALYKEVLSRQRSGGGSAP